MALRIDVGKHRSLCSFDVAPCLIVPVRSSGPARYGGLWKTGKNHSYGWLAFPVDSANLETGEFLTPRLATAS